RPVSVSIICWFTIAVAVPGMISLAYIARAPEILVYIGNTHLSLSLKIALLCVGALAQLIGAIGMLKAKNWARYLYLSSILSALFVQKLDFASLIGPFFFCAVQAVFLFGPKANRYFKS